MRPILPFGLLALTEDTRRGPDHIDDFLKRFDRLTDPTPNLARVVIFAYARAADRRINRLVRVATVLHYPVEIVDSVIRGRHVPPFKWRLDRSGNVRPVLVPGRGGKLTGADPVGSGL